VLRGIQPDKFRLAAAALLILFCSLSSIGSYARMFTLLKTAPQNYYLSDNLHKSLQWMGSNTGPGEVVLADMLTCIYIPRLSHNKAFTGQDMITNSFARKNEEVKRFLETRGDDDFKRNTVRKYNIRFVVYGPNETRPGGMLSQDHPWLSTVYRCGDVTVLKATP
jgi:hypothetical protein